MTPAFPEAAIADARAAARAFLRIETDGEDALIDTLAASALGLCEAFCGRAWIAREGWQDVLPVSRAWQALVAMPVGAIEGVEALSAEGVASALGTQDYAIDIDAEGCGWVRILAAGAEGRVRVTFGAGAAAEWGDLPPPIAQGVVLLIAHLFEHRGDHVAPPAAVAALWRPFRRLRLAGASHAA